MIPVGGLPGGLLGNFKANIWDQELLTHASTSGRNVRGTSVEKHSHKQTDECIRKALLSSVRSAAGCST